MFFSANWRFAALGTDYFQEGLPPSPLRHFRSLGVEEQFYFVWPWLLLGLTLLAVRLLGWHRSRIRVVAGAAITVVTVGSLAWAVHDTATSPTVAYFSSLSRAWELGVGAMVAVAAPRLVVSSVAVRTVLGYTGLAAIVVCLFVVPESPGFPAPWALAPVLATALVLAAGVGGDQPLLHPLTNRLSTYLGDLSFSLYLWHFPVIVLLAAVLVTGTERYYVAAAILTSALSILSFHLVEEPARRSSWFIRVPGHRGRYRPGRGWGIVAVAAIVMTTTVTATAHLIPGRSEGPTTSPFAHTSGGEQHHTCIGAVVMSRSGRCAPNTGLTLYPSPDQMSADNGHAFDCWILPRKAVRSCSYGKGGPGGPKVAVVGDSHAAMFIPGLLPRVDELGWQLDTYVGLGCHWWVPRPASRCTAMPDILKRLETGPKYDFVIVGGARPRASADTAEETDSYVRAWRPVAARGTRIIVLADTPLVTRRTIDCLTRVGFDPGQDSCSMSAADGYRYPDPLVAAAAELPGATLVDIRPFLCRHGRCPAVIGNVIVYRDTVSHLTATYSESLTPYLTKAIEEAMHDPGRTS